MGGRGGCLRGSESRADTSIYTPSFHKRAMFDFVAFRSPVLLLCAMTTDGLIVLSLLWLQARRRDPALVNAHDIPAARALSLTVRESRGNLLLPGAAYSKALQKMTYRSRGSVPRSRYATMYFTHPPLWYTYIFTLLMPVWSSLFPFSNFFFCNDTFFFTHTVTKNFQVTSFL